MLVRTGKQVNRVDCIDDFDYVRTEHYIYKLLLWYASRSLVCMQAQSATAS